jgi:hypothetical protein
MITLPPCSTSKVSMFSSPFELQSMQLSEGDEARKIYALDKVDFRKTVGDFLKAIIFAAHNNRT